MLLFIVPSAVAAEAVVPVDIGSGWDAAACVPSALNLCAKINVHAGPTGLYEFEGIEGVSPDLDVKIGETLFFDQRHPSNWFHPLGFAYEPDGAHGSTWGGDELPEVEGAGELQYFINGAKPTCDDAGDTGLDCYEPEFFYPRAVWRESTYGVSLKVTEAVAEASNGGVLYYFCHIHSKMSGKVCHCHCHIAHAGRMAGAPRAELQTREASCGVWLMCSVTVTDRSPA